MKDSDFKNIEALTQLSTLPSMGSIHLEDYCMYITLNFLMWGWFNCELIQKGIQMPNHASRAIPPLAHAVTNRDTATGHVTGPYVYKSIVSLCFFFSLNINHDTPLNSHS